LGGVSETGASLLTAEVCAMPLEEFARAGLVVEVWSAVLDEAVVFASDGARVGIQRPWARIRARAGLGSVRLHDLRHSFASVGVAANLGLPVLGAILGHRHPATTARYAHLDDDPRRAAAARISNQIAADLNGQPAGEVIPFKKA
jgi:site-specific recombinase XerD